MSEETFLGVFGAALCIFLLAFVVQFLFDFGFFG